MKKILLPLLLASTSSLAIAENEGQWYINPTLGYQYSDSERDLDEDALLGLGLEYQFNKRWGSEIKYLQGSLDGKYSNSNDADLKHLIAEGMYYIQSDDIEGFSPYIAAGIGHSEHDYDVIGKDSSTTGLFGPGFRYAFNDRWSSKVDLRWVHGIDSSDNDGLLTMAISYALGKTKSSTTKATDMAETIALDTDKDGITDANDNCPNTPSGTKVDTKGCTLDTDGDTIADALDKCPNTAPGAKVDAQGCAEKLTRTESITMNVNFPSSSAQLTNDYMIEIEKVAAFMRLYPKVNGVIEGHTDSSGSAAFNQKLSQQRADAVRTQLINKFRIDGSRLTAVGHGEKQPLVSNDTKDGRQKNRRVIAVFEAQVSK